MKQSSPLPDFKAVILDMDGLLLDTEAGYFIAWQQAAAAMDYELSDDFCDSLSGMHYSMLKQKLLEQCGEDFDLDKFHQFSGQFWRYHVEQNGIPLQSGFERLFEVLLQHEVPYWLATNSKKVNARECLQLAGVADLFTEFTSRDDVEAGKPAPDIFLKTAERLGCSIQDCIVIEDSLTGIEAAHRAGAYVICIPSVKPIKPDIEALSSIVLNDLAELAEIIQHKFLP